VKTYEQIMGKYKRTEQPQIEKELKADVRTHEGWLREREVEKHAEDPIKRARRERHAAIAMAIATRGKARYTEMQKETRIPDKTLSWDLKELVRTQKLKRRQDNSKWPPEVYYELTKKGYEDKKFQRALFAHREIYSLFQNSVFGPDHTRYEDPLVIAKNMISSTHLAALLILKLMVEDKAKRIRLEFTNKSRVDLTDYEDII